MYRYKLRDGGLVYERVSKRAARKVFDTGGTVVLCATKTHPFGYWRPGCHITKEGFRFSEADFYSVVRDYEFHNCNSETGRYSAYWVAKGDAKC